MAEDRKNPKKQAWVVEQAKREVEQAEQALKVAETAQDKQNAREDLREAKARLAAIQRSTRRDRRADSAVDQAQAAVDAAEKTPGTADDRKARARLDEAKQQAGRTEERKDSVRADARESFYSAMGPQISEAIKQFPELREFFRRAIEGRWDAAKQQRELNDPDNPWYSFWQAKGEYWRAGFQAQFGPNVTAGMWKGRIDKALEFIDAAALEKGVVLTEEERQNLARRYWYSEWATDNDALLSWMQQRRATKDEQGTNVPEDPEAVADPLLPASRNAKIRELADLAESYGLSFDNETLGMWADAILDNKKNVNGIQDTRFKEFLVQESRSKYAGFGDQLDGDTNLRQLAGGYISELSRLLELTPADIRLTPDKMDPLLQRALTDIDLATGKPRRIPLWEFSKQIRQDERWQFTNNARETYMSAGTKFAKALGLAG